MQLQELTLQITLHGSMMRKTMFFKCDPHVAYSCVRLGEFLLRNVGFVLGEICYNFMFVDHAVSKHLLRVEDIPSGPCEIHDEVRFKIVGIVDRL